MSFNSLSDPSSPGVSSSNASRWMLFVLGNGFDLQCGLKSQYRDFFEGRRPILEGKDPQGKTWGRYVRDHGLNLWDVILYPDSNEPWCDIEGTITEWVVNRAHIIKVLDRIREQRECLDSRRDDKAKMRPTSFYMFDFTADLTNPELAVAQYICQTTDDVQEWPRYSRMQFITRRDEAGIRWMYALLLDELHRMEADFRAYLFGQVQAAGEEYVQNARGLLMKMWEREMRLGDPNGRNPDRSRVSILDFNYTTPFRGAQFAASSSVVNIHGNLDDGDIVFGIDALDHEGTQKTAGGDGDYVRERMKDPNIVPFTKTYRLMNMGETPGIGGLLNAGGASRDCGPDEIVFYGHSLGPADWSYFNAIFDHVDLYGGDTKLVFYYTVWQDMRGQTRGERDETARHDREAMCASVTRLIDSYGATMDNKAHGANLLHKLLIEGRLSVKKIPTPATKETNDVSE